MKKKLDSNYTRVLWAAVNKSWRQHPTKQQLYSLLPSITKTIKVKQTKHARHFWRSKYELISDILLWTPSHGRAKAGRPARTYIQQLCANTGWSLEVMDDRDGWRDRVREICVSNVTWWWWWWWWWWSRLLLYAHTHTYTHIYIYIYIYIYNNDQHTEACIYIYIYGGVEFSLLNMFD